MRAGRAIAAWVSYWTLDRASRAADVAVKLAALLLALGTLLYFFLGPNVELHTEHQTFVDLNVLSAEYQVMGAALPPLVRDVASEYNKLNDADLRVGRETTLQAQPSGRRLCDIDPQLVASIFPATNCSLNKPLIGRGHYYERLLLKQNRIAPEHQRLTTAELMEAIGHLYDSEYMRARCVVKNVGSAKAMRVAVRISSGFVASSGTSTDPITLGPGEHQVLEYETHRGDERHFAEVRAGDSSGAPVVRFGVDWTNESGVAGLPKVLLFAGLLMIAIWLGLIANDIRQTHKVP